MAIATCDVCSGPANWCLDRAGDVWVRCLDDGCLSHLQVELFPEEPIWEERGTHPVSRDGTDESVWSTPSNTRSAPLDDLPF